MPPKSFAELLKEEENNPREVRNVSYQFVAGLDFQQEHLHDGKIDDFDIMTETLVEGNIQSTNGTAYHFSVEMYCYRDRIQYAGGEASASLAPPKKVFGYGI